MRKITEQEKSTAEKFASPSIAMFATSLIVYERWYSIALVVCGSLFALFSLYLLLPCDWKKSWFLKQVGETQTTVLLKYFGWFLVLAALGTNLIQTRITWLWIFGIIFAVLAYFVLFYGTLKGGKSNGN